MEGLFIKDRDMEQTCGMYLNNGVKNKSAQVIMMPVTIPDIPDFAPLSWLTADLEKDPACQSKKENLNMHGFL